MTAAGPGDALWDRIHRLASQLRAAGADIALSELLDAAESPPSAATTQGRSRPRHRDDGLPRAVTELT